MKTTFRELWNAAVEYVASTTRHPVGFLGVGLTTFAGVLLLVLLGVELTGGATSPYLGIIAFLVLPGFFLGGLILMPVGHWLDRKRVTPQGRLRALFPVIDFNLARVRTRTVLFFAITLANLCLFAVVSYRGIDFMESVSFCGETCHAVMHPEFTAYHNSPHSRVRCVDCHIGPGASWFVKSKLSGTRQVFAAILHTYPRPIPTPVHNLRPARETCEQCHWPLKFYGDRLVVKTHYREDENNTPLRTVLSLRVGGGPTTPKGSSIHWHVTSKVQYRSDETREHIYWVRAELPDGTVKEFKRPGEANNADNPSGAPVRTMDCVDCHNRPTHIYKPAVTALDEAMDFGSVPKDLPYIRREGLAALTAEYADKPAALAAIEQKLRTFYTRENPQLLTDSPEKVDRAVAGVQKVYADNVFPSMNITWTTYPNHLGHENFPGCFRCHDEELATKDGETISQDCGMCHSLLAVEEENPEILKSLAPEGE
jgi:hypothetical protein